MRFEVMISATNEAGELLWGYHHDEVITPTNDAEQNALNLAAGVIARIDEGRAAISRQAGVDVEFVAEEQEAAERHGRIRRVGRRGR